MHTTPVKSGESIIIGTAARMRARIISNATNKNAQDKEKFYFGLCLQYEHDQCFRAHGMAFNFFENLSDPFDRMYNNQWQDDKTSLRGKTITISQTEYSNWLKVISSTEDDVVINVFDQEEDDHEFRLLGSYSFRKIMQIQGNAPPSNDTIVKPSKFGSAVYIYKTGLVGCEA